MLNSTGKLKLGGGSINTLNESTILYGKGQNIKNIDNDNITVNRVVFADPLILTKIIPDNINDLPYSNISISSNVFYYKNEINLNFQKKLIPQSGIVLNNDSNISVDFSQSGWINQSSNIYTTINKIGIGTNKPIECLHIKNNNAAIIIDNNINKFKMINNIDNYFSFGNDNNHNEVLENDNFFKEQFKIHRDAPDISLVINNDGTVNIKENININKETRLTSNILINDINIVNWLGTNGLASYDYVSNIIDNMKPVDLTNLDYNNIKNNRLIFLFPLTSNVETNEIGIDLINSIGLNKIGSNIFTNNFKLGIGTNNPLGSVHIGSTSFSLDNLNANDGSLIMSKTTVQNTRILKFGFDNNFNFIIGNLNNNNNNWVSSIIIQQSAPSNCLIINNSGNVSFNNSLNINSNITLNGQINLNNFNISYNNNNFILGNSLLILNSGGNIGIGTIPDNLNQFIVNGNIKTNNDIIANNITVTNNGTFKNINLNNIIASSLIQTSNCIITSNLTTTSLISLTSINTQNLISSNLITAKNIIFSYLNGKLIDVETINSSSLISGLSLNISNDITSLSLSTSTINSTDLTSSNANIITLTSTDINNSGSIICNGNITCDNITTITNIKANGIIETPILKATNINGVILNITTSISSSIITSSNLRSTNITTDNLNVNTNINTPSIKAASISATDIKSVSVYTTGNITSDGTIKANIINPNQIICLNRIALNIANPIADLHIGNSSSSTINPSFIITYNDNNLKMGYDTNNNFIFGTLNRQTLIWNNQLSINKNAPNNSININASGNIGINKINNDNIYKIDVNGNLNAIKLFQNNEQVLTSANITSLINTSLVPYVTSNVASTLYSTILYVNNSIAQTTNYLEDTISKVLSQENAVYTSQKRYPFNNVINNTPPSPILLTYYSSFFGIKETITEDILVNNTTSTITYDIYSSTSSGYANKYLLFNYQTPNPSYIISWGENNYEGQYSVFKSSNVSTGIENSAFYNIGLNVSEFNKTYYGDYIIFKFNQPVILTKFLFYALNNKINSAPGNWVCFAANDNGTSIDNWTYIKDASIASDAQLNRSSYLFINETLLSYQKTVEMGNLQFQYYAFVFNKLIFSFLNPGTTLQLTRIELYAKYRIEPSYITKTLFNNTLANYSTVNQLNQKLNKNVVFTYPLNIDQYYQTISLDQSILINASTDQYLLSNLIVGYIKNQTAAWKSDDLNSDNIYYSYSGCIGIGTTRVNINNGIDVKLDVNGSINTFNINATSNIIANNFIGNGSLITNIDYNNIINKPNLKNINNWNIDTYDNIYNMNSGNIYIGFAVGNIFTSKFNVNGNIYNTGTIFTNAVQENGILLSDKYLSITNANSIYFKNSGGIIYGSIGINTTNTQGNILYINGNVGSSGIINANKFQENGIDISFKYTSITDATNNYLSKILGGTITGNVNMTESVAIGGATISPNYKLNVGGSILSSNIIYAITNINEGGVNLIDKYLTISTASNIYLSNSGGIIQSNLTINSNLGIGITASNIYRLNVNGNFNATNIYNNNILINFNSYAIKSDIDQQFLLYPTLTYTDNTYQTITSFNYSIADYTKTGSDLNYLNVNYGGKVNGLTTFSNLNTNNINISNILNVNNILTSNNLNVLNSITTPTILTSNIYTSNLYINGLIINVNSYAIKTEIDAQFLLYPTLTYTNTTYKTISSFNSSIADYTKTGLDLNYLNVNSGGNVNGLTTFSNINLNNINISNILNSSNLFSSNINVFNLNVGSSKSSFINSIYKLNVEGNFNASGIYSNNIAIDFNSYATTSLLNSSLNNYLTSNFISNNYVSNTTLNSQFLLYSQTGKDPTYLKLTENNTVSGNINFIGNVISMNLSNLSNLYSSNLYSSNLIIYSNLAINTNISSSYPLNVNGSIYSSNNIICSGNFNEAGTNLIDKYLTINNATLSYFPLNGGTITGNIGIGTQSSPSYRLNANGSIFSSNNIICSGNFNEAGTNLIDKYLTINNAILTYLPLNGGTIKTSLTITNNLGIGINASSAYKLSVNGSIYSTDSIYENGIALSQKYLSISGNIGIGTQSSPSYRLNVNGSIYSSNSIVSGADIIENGVKLSDKYLSIANASQYLITGDFLNNQPNLQKKIGFKFICNKPIILNNETYYKHDINISTYVRNKYDMIDMSNYRIFNIKCFSTLGVFTTMVANKPPNILQYDVYMSSYPSINICAIGFPSNYYLNKITTGDICLLKTTNYNYISVVSKTNNVSISCIISDFLF
jgi:hypothetical protein